MNRKYYYLDGKEQKGPFETEQLKSIGIKPDTFVWTVGFDDWKAAKDVAELNMLFNTQPQPSNSSNTEQGAPDGNGKKQRHGFVTFYLILCIISSSIIALTNLFPNLFPSDAVSELPENFSQLMVAIGVLNMADVVFFAMLLRWKKMGFWGVIGTTVIAVIISLIFGLDTGEYLSGFIAIAFLYGILQIKKNNVKAWDNLEQ